MSLTTTTTRTNKYLLKTAIMDQEEDKEERKREYNRLAQREFRRRRKEHLKNLEAAQKEQNSEQSEEIERLRYENDELRRENEALRAQLYGSSSSSSQGLLSTSVNVAPLSYDNRSYSLSPSVSGASISGTGSPPQTLHHEMMPMGALSMSTSMLTPSLQAYDTTVMSSQPYSLVHPSGLRQNSISSPETSEFRSARTLGPSFQSMSISPVPDSQGSGSATQRRRSGQSGVVAPYNRVRARNEVISLFQAYYSDPAITTTPERHLAVLQSLSATLPLPLKPNKVHLDTPHHFEIDMIASPTLRDRLLTVSRDVAQNFINEVGFFSGEDAGQFTIWGDDPLNEMSWEFSQPILERWGWLMGRDWVNRSNWWRRQRGATPLPEW